MGVNKRKYTVLTLPSVSPVSGTLRLQFVFECFRKRLHRVLKKHRRKVVRSIRVLEPSDSDGR